MKPRDLLTLRTSLPAHDWAWYGSSETADGLYRNLRYLELRGSFRERLQNSDLSYMVAGRLAAKVSGMTWEQLTKSTILDPLGMTSVGFRLDELARAQDRALPYRHDNGGQPKLVVPRQADAMNAAGGSVYANAEDMAKYLQMLYSGGVFAGKTVIAPADFKDMITAQIAMADSRAYAELGPPSYGLGLVLGNYRDLPLASHPGFHDGWMALIAFLPALRSGVYVAVNVRGSNILQTIGYAALDRLAGLLPIDWSGRFADAEAKRPASLPSRRKSDTRPSHDIDTYVGEYLHPGYGTIRIAHAEVRERGVKKGLTIELHGFKSVLEHFHYDVFSVPVNSLDPLREKKIQFVSDFDGEIVALKVVLEPSVSAAEFKRQRR